ncbi:MAG: Amino-acid acetyltransferase, mitochondrial [Piccolia ochrophora]|nr:MAG: Amino-acid acetyltransferase, mitochondrial [Piccolia ochrophora]
MASNRKVGLLIRNASTKASETESNPVGGDPKVAEHAQEKTADRDFFLSVLNSTSTKREARSYLSRFTPSRKAPLAPKKDPKSPSDAPTPDPPPQTNDALARLGINLGGFYAAKAVDQSPVFSQQPLPAKVSPTGVEPLHVALVKIRQPQILDDSTLDGIGLTLSQLRRLGLMSAVVIDIDGLRNTQNARLTRKNCLEQADRVVAAIGANAGAGAWRVDQAIAVSATQLQAGVVPSTIPEVCVSSREMLVSPLKRGIIPVLMPIGYTSDTLSAVSLDADVVVVALAREFAGFSTPLLSGIPSSDIGERIQRLQKQVSLDRFIVLDPLGGIPSQEGLGRNHVYINMEQEFNDIRDELVQMHSQKHGEARGATRVNLEQHEPGPTIARPQALTLPLTDGRAGDSRVGIADFVGDYNGHLRNLETVQRVLALLPTSSSALLTTPEEAANSGRPSPSPFMVADVGTRRQRNPLIHNLLTDKPAFSSSLPPGRLGPLSDDEEKSPTAVVTTKLTTFFKRGMPLTILPDPKVQDWSSFDSARPRLTLKDPRVDLPRLINLIEDSFDRKLDVEHYLSRVNDRIAGIIVAGEYEGCALLTWETPPGVAEDGGEVYRRRRVPYLDKFAVLKRSQGAGGVADVLFTAMVRRCFPDGVCWRSRRNNPVNKWYFERARGTWKLPETSWTMFWTTENLMKPSPTFLDYASGMCKNLVEKGEYEGGVVIYNRTIAKAEALNRSLPGGKTEVARSFGEVTRSADIIFTCLSDDQTLLDTYDAIVKEEGIEGTLFVDCSTVHPDTTNRLEELLQKVGALLVACPVFGAPPMAESGQLVCVLAGPGDLVERVKPYTTGVMGRTIIDFSGQPCSRALLLKIIGNTFILNMVESLAQGHTLSEKTGLGSENLHQFLEALFPGPFVAYSNRLMSGDYYKRDPPAFGVDLAIKDAKHALSLAESSGTRIKSVEMADAHLAEVKKERAEKGDIAGIYGVVRKESGLEYENGK